MEKNADTLSKKSEKSHKEIFELKARLAERESLRESEGAQGSAAQNEREKITQVSQSSNCSSERFSSELFDSRLTARERESPAVKSRGNRTCV